MTVQVICGDSMRIMTTMTDKLTQSFQMIFIDPPYWTGKKTEIWQEPGYNALSYLCNRLLKKHGVIWLCGTQPHLVHQWSYWKRFFELNTEIIWDKVLPTTAIACEGLKRNCLGIEINPKYVKLYKRRTDRIRMQEKLKKWTTK